MAASACIGFSADNFLDISMPHQDNLSDLPLPDPDLPLPDFEFRLEDPVIMLPADQLFSEGKLIPLHQPTTTTTPSKPRRRVSVADPFLYSPKAPPSRWKQFLGFRKLDQNNNNNIAIANANGATKSIKQFLQRASKSPNDKYNLPLLKDTDNERLSLSSSSSSSDELPLDSEKPGAGKVNNLNPPRMRMRMVKISRADGRRCPAEGIESPRMNSSGKIVFQSLERSSSSPSSLNGGLKHRGMERSYSGNVRVSRVLNVPVRKSGGVFGLPLFSSPQNQNQKREAGGSRKSKTS